MKKCTLRDILRRLRDEAKRKLSEKLFLLHGNVPAHQSVLVKDFGVKYNVSSGTFLIIS